MKWTARTHAGQKRPLNEDSYLVPEKDSLLFAVADGIGGHLAGEVASQLAVASLLEYTGAHASHVDELTMRAAFRVANEAIYDQSHEVMNQRGMGTTMSALWLRGEGGIVGHVGDSRIYLFRDGALQLLTRDHTLVEELLEMGEITEEEARNHPHRNIVTRALGTSSNERVDTQRIDVIGDDIFLLCTDGLTSYLTDEELGESCAAILEGEAGLDEMADELLETALARGGHDNITLIIAQNTGGATA